MVGATTNVDILVVGAGAYGLSCAWHMTQLDPRLSVMVVDGGEFASGASGRNGAGFRMQWALEFNIRLSKESIEFFEDVQHRLDYPAGIDLKQTGYLIVARSPDTMERLRQAARTQAGFGVPTQIMSVDDCIKMVPALDREEILGGTYCHKDGCASPFLWLDALLCACRRNRVQVSYGTRVEKLSRVGGHFRIETGDGAAIHADRVLLCTDWQVPELLRPLDVDLPITGLPKEILVSEACPEIVRPTVISMDDHIAASQLVRGSIVFTVTRDRKRDGDLRSKPDFLDHAASRILSFLPGVRDVRILRCWAGVSSETPDMQAVLGETEIRGLYVAVSAYKGFMTSPAVGRLMASLILEGNAEDPTIAPLHPRRFAEGRLVPEPLTNQDVTKVGAS